jgi:hypothetical protein
VGLGAGLDAVTKTKIPVHVRNQTPTLSLVTILTELSREYSYSQRGYEDDR